MSNNHEPEPEPEPDWSQIPADILFTISKTFKNYSDYIRLRSVCVNFHEYLPPTPTPPFPCQFPWLLLPPSRSSTTFHSTLSRIHHQTSRRSFYNILNGKIHSLNLPEASYPRRICGSCNGWLVLVGDTPDMFCLNPLTRFKVFLSPLSNLPCVVSFSYYKVGREYLVREVSSGDVFSLDLRQMRDVFVRKVILSCDKSGSPVIALGIVSFHVSGNSELVFCNVDVNECENGRYWKPVSVSGFSPEDVIYCECDGLFYAVNKVGDVLAFDITNDNVGNNVEIFRSESTKEGDLHYLVKSKGELLLVSRTLGAEADLISYCEVYETVGFDVYRFRETGEGQACWDKVTDLDDRVVFVGENSSLALLASDFPGCKGNCIYFTDDHSKCGDVGIFDLGSRCIESLPCYPQDTSLPLRWAPPIWITPNLC